MKTPSPNELRVAIKILTALCERIDNDAAERVMRLPDCAFGDRHATRIESQTLEQTARIEAVITELNIWQETLRQRRGIHV